MPPLPPALLDELLEEVFLRLPPDEPDHLVRASSVCRPWRRVIAGRGFRRRYLKFHGAPPVLGLLCNSFVPTSDRFVPTSAFRPADHLLPGWFAVDCRHGRALFVPSPTRIKDISGDLLVWDPLTGDRRHVPSPDINMAFGLGSGAAVLCAAQGCDHSGCHGGPFRVAVVSTDAAKQEISSRLYSSETGTWSQVTSVHHPHSWANHMPSVLVGDALYFAVMKNQIIEYRLGTLRLSLSDLLPDGKAMFLGLLMMAEGGGLGFAKTDGSTLTLWSRETDPNGAPGWAQHRVINLETLLPRSDLWFVPGATKVLGFAEGTKAIFVGIFGSVYVIELK
ncbi:uncharacterized protein LOC100822187 [Brachypodium distachyon]|uniref:uncharacterized protein LOC100822187 n=1 Tax=Brachypodium distachyon TaxID=15368 RepID=UPI0001D43056|nr:uncharacterized protein LOC100822187 [Brachypodium distachyon]|eukprot:XP_003561494.1 uncharacterized protein LOC100822187 [Brachypodium distachyon]